MNIWTRLRQACCLHRHVVRERHDLDRAKDVLHFVCTSCGRKAPAVTRSIAEHRAAVRAGKGRAPKAKRSVEPVPFRKAAR